jgi:hypothetical protein
MKRFVSAIAAVVAAVTVMHGFAGPGPAHATTYQYHLLDHPDGLAVPPPYGIRFDGMEYYTTGAGGQKDLWTFSFDQGPASVMGVLDTALGTFRIFGTVWGGLHNDPDIRGRLAIDFTYTGLNNVKIVDGHPSFVMYAPQGSGSFTFLDDVASFTAGHELAFSAWRPDTGGYSFRFRPDGYRLSCPDDTACESPVGWGRLGLHEPDGSITYAAYRGWLFTSVPVPEPSALAVFGLGLFGLGLMRRRLSAADAELSVPAS